MTECLIVLATCIRAELSCVVMRFELSELVEFDGAVHKVTRSALVREAPTASSPLLGSLPVTKGLHEAAPKVGYRMTDFWGRWKFFVGE